MFYLHSAKDPEPDCIKRGVTWSNDDKLILSGRQTHPAIFHQKRALLLQGKQNSSFPHQCRLTARPNTAHIVRQLRIIVHTSPVPLRLLTDCKWPLCGDFTEQVFCIWEKFGNRERESNSFVFFMLRQMGSRVGTVAASFWVSPLGEELHGLDVKPLSGCDVLTVGQLHCSLDGAGQALVQAGGGRRPHQLQARADHIAHNCSV